MKEKIKTFFKKEFVDYLWITVGVIIIAFAFSFLLDPYNLVIGGVSGAAVIFETVNVDPSISILIINAILLIIDFIVFGAKGFFKTAYGSILYPIVVKPLNLLYAALVNANNGNVLVSQANNMLLITLFSAIIMGFGIGLTVKYGGTTGGTEIPQNILYKWFKLPYSLSLFIIDGGIVFAGFLVVRDSNGALQYDYLLYEVLFIYLSGIVMDEIIFRGFNKRAVYIISEKNEEIKQRVLNDFERGVTEINVVGGYTGKARTKLVCVLSSNQFYRLKQIIKDVDPHAFYYVTKAAEVGGEGFTYDERNINRTRRKEVKKEQ